MGKCQEYQHTYNRSPKRRGKRESIREEQQQQKKFDEIMAKNSPNLKINIILQIQETQRILQKRNTKPSIPRHIIVKLQKAKEKEKILKAASEKQLMTWRGVDAIND